MVHVVTRFGHEPQVGGAQTVGRDVGVSNVSAGNRVRREAVFRAALVVAWAALAASRAAKGWAQDSVTRPSASPAARDSAARQPPAFFAVRAVDGARINARNAAVLQRQESLALMDVPVGTAVQAIADRAQLEVTFSNELIPSNASVSLKADDVTVAAALMHVLSHTKLDVLVGDNGHLTLVPRGGQEVAVDSSGVLTGSLANAENGEPIPDASIAIVGTDRIAFADAHGRFLLPGLAANRHRSGRISWATRR